MKLDVVSRLHQLPRHPGLPHMGFMVGQRYQCQDCEELMVIPLEFDTQEDYEVFLEEMGGHDEEA